MLALIVHEPLRVDVATAHVAHPSSGAIALFVGVVRDAHAGRAVDKLEYTAYESMAQAELGRIVRGVEERLAGGRVAAIHRVGMLLVGDAAVVCAVSTPHRAEAFDACRALVDEIKARVPIWKREYGPTGASWVGWGS
jgi:molybdopterin synthase catalytic subunit